MAKLVSTSLSKMAFTRPEKLFEENNFLKTFTKVTCFWFWAKNAWQDAQTAFTCPVEKCWKVEPRGENESFLSFPHIMWNIFATSNEIGRVVKLAFIISKGTFWRKSRLNETVFRFSPCFDFEQKTLGRVVTPASSASRGRFWKKTLLWTILYFFQFGWMTFGRVENRNLRVQKNIFGDFFWKSVFCIVSRTLSRNFVSLFTNCFRHFFQNWHPSV